MSVVTEKIETIARRGRRFSRSALIAHIQEAQDRIAANERMLSEWQDRLTYLQERKVELDASGEYEGEGTASENPEQLRARLEKQIAKVKQLEQMLARIS